MKRITLAVLIPFIFIVSCQKEQDASTVLEVRLPKESRTHLESPAICWNTGDAIVVNGQRSTGMEVKDGGRSALLWQNPFQICELLARGWPPDAERAMM